MSSLSPPELSNVDDHVPEQTSPGPFNPFDPQELNLASKAFAFVCDMLIMYGAFAWKAEFSSHSVSLPLILALLLRIRWIRQFIVTRIAYVLVAAYFADNIVLGLLPMRCVSDQKAVLSAATIPLTFLFLFWQMRWTVRTFAYSVVPCAAAVLIIVGAANHPSTAQECAIVRAQPGIETLIELHEMEGLRGLPRFAVRRPDRNDMIVSYRSSVGAQRPDVWADQIDLVTGEVIPIPFKSEIIGMHYEQATGQLLVAHVERRDEVHPKTLAVYDASFEMQLQLDFDTGGKDDYNAYFVPFEGRYLIRTEEHYWFDPTAKTLTRGEKQWGEGRENTCDILAETGFELLDDNQYVVAGGGSLLFSLLNSGDGACLFDVANRTMRKYEDTPPGGAWDVAVVPERDELLLSSFWQRWVMLVSTNNMTERARFDIGPCIRPVAYNRWTNKGYAHECFSGILNEFDVNDGRILEKRFVGKNARKIYTYEDLGTIILSGCGVYRIPNQDPRMPLEVEGIADEAQD